MEILYFVFFKRLFFEFLNTIFLFTFIDVLVPKWKVNWKDFLPFTLTNLFGLCSEKHPAVCQAYLDTLTLCGDRLQELLEKYDYMLLMDKYVILY